MTDDGFLQLIAEALDCTVESLTPDSGLGRHPDWTSLGQLNLMLTLEKNYGVPISDDTIRANQTLAGVLDTCRRAEAARRGVTA